jgi:hypothetical protein
MGLKTLQSNLRTGLDYPDGGTWLGGPNQRPLMTKPLIDFSGNVGSAIDTFTGGLIRGGAATHLERNLTDLARITKFLITPKGIGFIAKQVGLQLSNPRMDKPMSGFGAISDANQRTYTPLTTLASVASAGTGLYFDREGLIPGVHKGYLDATGGPLGTNLFADPIEGKGDKNKQENRLLYLYQDKIQLLPELTPSKTGDTILGKIGAFGKKVGSVLGFGGKGEELFSYQGGPDSLYGIGKTTIRRYSNTNFLNTPNTFPDQEGKLSSTTNVGNYLKYLGRPYFDYQKKTKDQNRTFNRESRIGTGNPGVGIGANDDRVDGHISQRLDDGVSLNYQVYDEGRLDKVNMLDIVKGTNSDFTGDGFRDLIRFRFEAVNSANPTKSDAMIFRAFLDGFTDNYSANHNEFNYNGRGESFYTYNSFKRSIGFSFKIAAQTRYEMMPIYRKLNFLASNTSPEYNKSSGRMMTPFMRVTIGSYLNRIPGVINSIGITWQKDYPWEIAIDSPENGMDKSMLVLPHVLDVSCQFTPIHNFLPQKSVTESPFILPHHDGRDGTIDDLQRWLKPGAQTPTQAHLSKGSYENLRTNSAAAKEHRTDSGEEGREPVTTNPNDEHGTAINVGGAPDYSGGFGGPTTPPPTSPY